MEIAMPTPATTDNGTIYGVNFEMVELERPIERYRELLEKRRKGDITPEELNELWALRTSTARS